MSDELLDMTQFYPWEIDVFEYNRKVQQGLAKKYPSMWKDGMPKAKFSDILRFLRLCRETRDIWDGFIVLQKRLDNGETYEDVWDHPDGIWKRHGAAVDAYSDWYFIKYDIQGPRVAYLGVTTALRKVAEGALNLSDRAAVRHEFECRPFTKNEIDFDA